MVVSLSIYCWKVGCEVNPNKIATSSLNLASHLGQATVRSRSEYTKLGTFLSLTMIFPVCWLIPRRDKDYVPDITGIGVQRLNVTPIPGTALQFVIFKVSPVDSVIQKGNSMGLGVAGKLNSCSDAQSIKITGSDFIATPFSPIKPSGNEVYGQTNR